MNLPMWLIAAVLTLGVVIGGIYETVALRFHRLTITEWTSRNPHAAILVFTGLGLAFGYALGIGGH
jgi:hypothetical protein